MVDDEMNAIEAASGSQPYQKKLLELKAMRTSTKASISRIRTTIAKKGSELSPEELECRLGILDSYFKQMVAVQANIDKIAPDAEADANSAFMADIEEAYVSTRAKILSLIGQRRSSTMDATAFNASLGMLNGTKLRRQINIPKFEGKYAEYPRFWAIFSKMVHRDDSLDNCERFLILKENLGTKPLAVIAEFDETEENYPKAIARLKEVYDKKVLMFEEHMRALFQLPRATKASAEHLRQVVNSINAHVSAMLTLGTYENISNAMFIFLAMKSIDVESQVKWEESLDFTTLPSWNECSILLTKRCQQLEAREVKVSEKQNATKDAQRNQGGKRSGQASLIVEQPYCECCQQGGHDISSCEAFKNLKLHDRYNVVRQQKLCMICLRKGHMKNRCQGQKCSICKKPHNIILHRYIVNNVNGVTAQESTQAEGQSVENVVKTTQVALQTAVDGETTSEVLLATVVILVKDVHGQYHKVRAILDSASQMNLICDKLVRRLMLKQSQCIMGANGIGDIATSINRKTQANIRSRVSSFQLLTEFYVLSKITGKKPEQKINISNWNIPNNMQMADPAFNEPCEVEMLLGAEVFIDLLTNGRIFLGENLPRLQSTKFGWVVLGAVRRNKAASSAANCMAIAEEELPDGKLAELVERFWHVEELPIQTAFLTEEEQECERIVECSAERDMNGRFILKIPFKHGEGELGESFEIARRRFLALERRLEKDSAIKKAYTTFMEEYMELGHMKLVEARDVAKIKYFAPHQHVLRPDSSTTKLRVVFDCSSKTSTGLSLNDVMMKGPVIQDDLLSIVLRFRCYKYALTADVSKMYRQAWVAEEDSYYQGILWRSDKEEELRPYRLCTVTYGTTSAPYLATKCLKMLGEENAEKYPLGAQRVLHDFYMDDLLTGADTEEDLSKVFKEVKTVMDSAHFSLRKWCSNNERFLSKIPESEQEKLLLRNGIEVIKALGIVWQPKTDHIRYLVPKQISGDKITKRKVLSETAAFFDPLGIINPVIVKAKIFLQDLWLMKLKWDEALPVSLHKRWEKFREKAVQIEDICIERYVSSTNTISEIELHGFADASMRAYGSALYVRTVSVTGVISVKLWTAKSRVAPLKTKSLPRLELMAAELLAQLLLTTRGHLPWKCSSVYLWSDSKIVLDWLKQHPSEWNVFVANRVAKIQETTKEAIWRHVPTKSNPADVVSRGAYADELVESIWLTGPSFLKKPEQHWPIDKRDKEAKITSEERRHVFVGLNANGKEEFLFADWLEKHSSFEKVKRLVGVLLVAFRRQVLRPRICAVSPVTLDKAMLIIVHHLQKKYFSAEWVALERHGEAPRSSKFRSLSIFLQDSQGVAVIRVGGRLKNALLPYEAKHQLLLPDKSPLVWALVNEAHRKYHHAGTQALMAITRQRFWIVHARKVLRSVTCKCLLCFRYRPRLQQQLMGQLPASRVRMGEPFQVSGVDFCGPFTTTLKLRGHRTTKSYIAVFVCFATKGVHLEVVSDLSTQMFILAFKRFVARRGMCSTLYCDNATNFVGARRELQDLKKQFFDQQQQRKIAEMCTAYGVEFRHIPPRSPHFGGLWEAAVKSTKYHLNRALHLSHFTFEELSTFVAEVEAILNSRPLVAMSNDPNDEEVITPGHLMLGRPPVAIAEPLTELQEISPNKRWQRVVALQQHFWRRWSCEYLHELQRKVKWSDEKRNVQVGDLVLVAEENMAPRQWLMARVVNTIPDSEGKIRIVELGTKRGNIRRAVTKVAVLPKADMN